MIGEKSVLLESVQKAIEVIPKRRKEMIGIFSIILFTGLDPFPFLRKKWNQCDPPALSPFYIMVYEKGKGFHLVMWNVEFNWYRYGCFIPFEKLNRIWIWNVQKIACFYFSLREPFLNKKRLPFFLFLSDRASTDYYKNGKKLIRMVQYHKKFWMIRKKVEKKKALMQEKKRCFDPLSSLIKRKMEIEIDVHAAFIQEGIREIVKMPEGKQAIFGFVHLPSDKKQVLELEERTEEGFSSFSSFSSFIENWWKKKYFTPLFNKERMYMIIYEREKGFHFLLCQKETGDYCYEGFLSYNQIDTMDFFHFEKRDYYFISLIYPFWESNWMEIQIVKYLDSLEYFELANEWIRLSKLDWKRRKILYPF